MRPQSDADEWIVLALARPEAQFSEGEDDAQQQESCGCYPVSTQRNKKPPKASAADDSPAILTVQIRRANASVIGLKREIQATYGLEAARMRIVLSEFDPGAAVGAREGNRDNAAETLPDTRAIDFYRVQDDAVSAEIQRKIYRPKKATRRLRS